MDLTTELQKLAALRAEGALTEAEFKAAKERLLGAQEKGAAASAREPVEAAPAFEEKVYWSSRWSAGNLFFRDRLVLAADGITFRKGAMFSSDEEHISYAALASFRVKNRLFLADLTFETSGGSQPVFINGLWKSDAREIQDVIRQAQARAQAAG